MQQQPAANLDGFQNQATTPASEEYIGPAMDADFEDGLETYSDTDELACPQRGGFKASLAIAAAIKLHAPTANVQPAPAATATAPADDFFSSLLGESLALQKDKVTLKDSRAKLKDTRVQGAERSQLEDTIRSIELVQEWSIVSNVVIFNQQFCTHCKAKHSTFSGLFQRQVSKTSRINRWQAIKELTPGFPKEAKHTVTEVAICCDCALEQDWKPEALAVYAASPAKAAIVTAMEKSEKLAEEKLAKAQSTLDKFLL